MRHSHLLLIGTLFPLINFAQAGFNGVINYKLSDTTIDFPICTSSKLNWTGYATGSDLALYFYCKDSLFHELNQKLGVGKIESYQVPGLGQGSNDFIRIHFYDSLPFIKTIFNGEVNFTLSKFDKDVSFYAASFNKEARFMLSEFNANCGFEGVRFYKPTLFSGLSFKNNISFEYATFYDYSEFGSVDIIYSGYLLLEKSREIFSKPFNAESKFRNIFSNGANFSFATFSKDVTFRQTSFIKNLSFRNAVFDKKLSFFNIDFPKYIDFDNAQMPDSLYIWNSNFDSVTSNIFLNNVKLDFLRARSGNNSIRCKLFLKNIDLTKLVIDPSKFLLSFHSNTSYDEKVGVYEQVIKKCKDMGLEESVRGFDIDLQKLRIKHKYKLSGLLIWLNKYWWNFGYERTKIFKNTICAFAISFLIFFLFLKRFSMAYFPHQLNMSLNKVQKLKNNNFGDISTRFKVSLFYSMLIFFGLKMEHAELKYREYPIRTFLLYLIFVIGIIHLAYLISVILNK
jgi:hypothetical protein